MSPSILIALLLLPLLGALIAWAGDVIGYRLGKSRRSLFGLRPRSTARLIGVLVGAALPLAGLAFAMAVSQDARDAVLRIRELREQAVTLGRQNQSLSADIEHARGEAREALKRAHGADLERVQAEQNLAGTQRTLVSSQALLRSTQVGLQSTRAGLAAARGELTRARGDLTRANGDLTKTRGDLAKANGDLAKTRGDLAKANGDLATANSDLTKTKADLTQTHGELSKTQDELTRSQAELTATRDELTAAQKRMESMKAELENLGQLERHIAGAEEHLSELEGRLAATQERLSDTQQTLARYRIAARAIVQQEVAFEPGAEIIRSFVESGRTQEQLEAILNELLSFASEAAAHHGIATGPDGRAVVAISPVPPEMLLSRVRESDVISGVARQIRRGGAPTYVVIVRSWGRAFRDAADPMPVEFWAAPNKVVFKAGEVILTGQVDGSLPRANGFRGLWGIVSGIRRVAGDRGMLPSPQTGHYGEVPAEELLEALDKVLAVHGPATVKVVVAADARVAPPEDAPMKVTLEVSGAPPH